MRRFLWSALSVYLAIGSAGCVQRTLTIRSNPPGALVYLNDQEIGRTPVTRNFLWYGIYDVELRKEGYETVKSRGSVIAPWWQWMPFDLISELLPVTDRHELQYTMRPPSPRQDDPVALVRRGEVLRGELGRSERPYDTTPATQPVKREKKRDSVGGRAK